TRLVQDRSTPVRVLRGRGQKQHLLLGKRGTRVIPHAVSPRQTIGRRPPLWGQPSVTAERKQSCRSQVAGLGVVSAIASGAPPGNAEPFGCLAHRNPLLSTESIVLATSGRATKSPDNQLQ